MWRHLTAYWYTCIPGKYCPVTCKIRALVQEQRLMFLKTNNISKENYKKLVFKSTIFCFSFCFFFSFCFGQNRSLYAVLLLDHIFIALLHRFFFNSIVLSHPSMYILNWFVTYTRSYIPFYS